MTDIFLRFEIVAGCDWDHAAAALVKAAERIQVTCIATHNETEMQADPGDTVADVLTRFDRDRRLQTRTIDDLEF